MGPEKFCERSILETRHGWPPRNTLLPYLCYTMPTSLKVRCQTHRKFWPVASCFLRSLGVIGTGTDWSATYDFLLALHSNHGPTSYRFCDKKRWLQCSPIARVFNAPWRGFPWNFVTAVHGARKTRMMPLSDIKKVWRYVKSFNISHCQTDGQTNGRADFPSRSAYIACWRAM